MKMENIDKTARLAALRQQLVEEEMNLQAAKEAAAKAQRGASRSDKLIAMIRRQIEAVEKAAPMPGMPAVSDHAVVRYLERAHGLNIDGVKAEMLDARTCASIQFLNGAHAKINANGLIYVVEHGTVITVYENGDAS
jgi:hypothetical protein